MSQIPGLVVAHDAGAEPAVLPFVWKLGTAFDRTPHSLGVTSWEQLIVNLANLGVTVTELHLWSHGQKRGPLIGGVALSDLHLEELAKAAPALRRVWWRSCDVGRDHTRVAEISDALEATSVQHCVVISSPLPWRQGAICALRYGEQPWWDPEGDGLRGCSALRMTVPDFAYREV